MTPLEPFTIGPVSVAVEGRVAVATLARGDALNALSVDVMEALKAVAHRLREDVSTSALVITGDPSSRLAPTSRTPSSPPAPPRL